jgi:MFS family permease
VAGTETERASAAFIMAFWLAQLGNWLGLLTPVAVTIALRVAQIGDPLHKTAQLGTILGVGAMASIIATPIWGYISDHTPARIGRRKLWMIVGVAGGGVGLLVMAAATGVAQFGVGRVIAQIAFNANQAALNALLPDQIPDAQRGRVSGLLGLSSIVAIVIGTFITRYTADQPYLLFLAPWLGTVLTLLLILFAFKDQPAALRSAPPASWRAVIRAFHISPRDHPDFYWAWLSRFLVILGAAYLQTYSVYFLSDRIRLPMAQIPTLIFFSTGIGAAITVMVSPLGGWLSDRTGRRKPFVFAAALVAAIGLLVIGSAQELKQFFIGSAVTSIGISLYYAVDLALVAAVLPDPDNSAKDMGLFTIANTLPQSLAPAIAPVFLAIGSMQGGNYIALFASAALFAAAGAFSILPVKRVR